MQWARGVTVAAIVMLAAGTPLAGQAAGSSSYRLGPGDQVSVNVREDEGLNVTRRISEEGTITLPLVGDMAVGGLTLRQAGARLEQVLEQSYLQQATAEILVLEFRSQPIVVIGAVNQPGTHYLDGRWTLLDAINAAGGLTPSHQSVASIRRRSSNGLADQLELDLSGLVNRRDLQSNVTVLANDVISIPAAQDITVYFLGESSTQGAITLLASERATLLTAIAKAGGLTERASPKLVIRRARGGGEPIEIPANFRRILSGADPDIPLEHGDLIVVKEAFL